MHDTFSPSPHWVVHVRGCTVEGVCVDCFCVYHIAGYFHMVEISVYFVLKSIIRKFKIRNIIIGTSYKNVH